MHKKIIAFGLGLAALLFISSCSAGRTIGYMSPINGQVSIVGVSNIVITGQDITNGAGTYQNMAYWAATGKVVVKDSVGDVGYTITPSQIVISRKDQRNTSSWATVLTLNCPSSDSTNVTKALTSTNDSMTIAFNAAYQGNTQASGYTNTATLTYTWRGNYSISGTTVNGQTVQFTGADLNNASATFSWSGALTN